MTGEYQFSLEVERGIELINRGEFFRAHEVLESAWLQEKGKVRPLIQGLVQVSVLLYHIERDNQKGAYKLVLKALENISPFKDLPSQLDIPLLIDDLTSMAARFHTLKTDEPIIISVHPIRLYMRN